MDLLLETKSEEIESMFRTDLAAYFRGGSPNRIHFLIAAVLVLRQDVHVITTNYDNCIEQAVATLSKRFSSVRDIRALGVKDVDKVDFKTGNLIVKIHGCATLDTPRDVVLTTKQEAKGFPGSLSEKLQELFQESLVVFMGHSLSEPDTVEALSEISEYDVMWIGRNLSRVNQNKSARYLLEKAKRAYFVEGLEPFILNPWCEEGERLWGCEQFSASIPKIKEGFTEDQRKKQEKGIEMFERLAHTSSIEHLLRIAANGYLQLREFAVVSRLLNSYSQLSDHSLYNYHYWVASITRDQNDDWKAARNEFELARSLGVASPLERFSALVERLGLDTLLCKRSQVCLKRVEDEIVRAIALAKDEMMNAGTNGESGWSWIIGRLQKNLIQNLGRQNLSDRWRYESALRLADDTISVLNSSRSIHARVETERFKARILFRYYRKTKLDKILENAADLTGKCVRIFELLGSSMGTINARRQYAMLLIESGHLAEADSEVQKLYELTRKSVDRLSYRKTLAVHALLCCRRRDIAKCALLSMQFVWRSIREGGSRESVSSLLGAAGWYHSFLNGREG